MKPASPNEPTSTASGTGSADLAATRAELQAQIAADTMTPREACEALNISRRTYYRLVEEGAFHPVVFRGRVRVPRAEVIAYLDELRAVAGIVGALAASKRSPGSAA